MSYRRCINCRMPQRILCWECGRMLVATVVAELLVAAVLWVLRG